MAKKDKRRQIMAAAERLFTSRRFHEITLDDIAKIARVGKGTIYLYFKDKDDLFLQTASSGYDELQAILQAVAKTAQSGQEKLRGAARRIREFFERRRQLFHLMQDEEQRALWHRGGTRERGWKNRQKILDGVTAIIREGVAAGQLRSDIDERTLAGFFLGLLRAQAHGGGMTGDKDKDYDMVVELFCRGAVKRKG